MMTNRLSLIHGQRCLALVWCVCIFVPSWGISAPIDFVRDVRPIFEKHCYSCHGEEKQKSGLRLDIRQAAFQGGDGRGPSIIPGKPSESPLIELISNPSPEERMPPDGPGLSQSELSLLRQWVEQGAVWPDGVDRAVLEDRRAHWSFQPLRTFDDQKSIDDFVREQLNQKGLAMSKAASPLAWLRRVTLDLIGLPPTVAEVDEFLKEVENLQTQTKDLDIEASYAKVVDRLLRSERYGERWAQHWLDVVRYADTHGFEVNTERPNAWPYRDYVIRAMNRDTPYDQFLREQIVGDLLNEDAATGFLVTASVLLPGQIGKDAASIRLARQDSLDEIVNNISQTFLGLSVGCARCHDHKFDAISAVDYYAMQAMVAGVEYEDREIRSAESEERKKSVEPLKHQVRAIGERLAHYIPIARPGSQFRQSNARENIETFPPLHARFVKFTIHDSNLHPSLGLIEPCIDELEIWTEAPEPRNVALASSGTRVTASGSRTSASHKLEHVHDGKYGNSHSWMSNEKGRGWLLFELPKNEMISKVVWSRDRNGKYEDRLPVAYVLEAGPSLDKLETVSEIIAPRPVVGAAFSNVDRIEPVRTNGLRFTILETNSLEPCLDELEVLDASGKNIALASLGTRIKTSGNQLVTNRHDPSYLNDGQYGNDRSWLANQTGKGWVELQFPSESEVTRIVWSRDRTGKLEDRLPIEYRIEVATPDGWHLVADSTDRKPHLAGIPRGPEFTLSGLSVDEVKQAQKLLEEKASLEARIQAAQMGQLAFAGRFREPDKIHLLLRGDPEQPKQVVPPAVLSALGGDALAPETPEQERRKALADWLANPKNPLTARVMVNRIWQGHFGRGIVASPSDFGRNGMKPSHPELLDWLAMEFIRKGWSIKHMHRLIVLSKTYRQSSRWRPEAGELDADTRWLWRYPPRRLEAESIRDAILFVSGLLNPTMYGRGFDLFDKRGGLSGFNPIENLRPDNQRRMIYAHKVRREPEAVFGAFDCPDAGQSTATRRDSTTPIQALNLFNSQFTQTASRSMADLLRRESGESTVAQIRNAYRYTLNRSPTHEEIEEATPVVEHYGLAALCRALFNSNEFLFIP